MTEDSGLKEQIAHASTASGERFALRCKACHTLEKGGANKLGPNLWSVIGRKQASVDGFRYSNALQQLNGEWTLAELDKFLSSPGKYVPGNRMAFPGVPDPAQRHALLAYLATLSDAAPAATAKAAPPRDEPSFADELDLPEGAGREEVAAICSACHSFRLVRQQGLDAYRWDELMDWMTEKQGMPALAPEERDRIVAYLAENFGPQSRSPAANPMSPMAPLMPPPPAPPQ
ncbi:MAG: cytochrome c family protein [Xanthobacteraceae bacterium]